MKKGILAALGAVGLTAWIAAQTVAQQPAPLSSLFPGGALLYAGLKSTAMARTVNTGVGAVYLLVGVLGLFLLTSPLNIIALNGADNVLHLASAVLLLGVGLSMDKSATAVRA